MFDAHRDESEFGYRLLADEALAAGYEGYNHRVWRICGQQGWLSAFGRRGRSGKGGRPGPPAHDDKV